MKERERDKALYKPQKPIIRNKLSNIIHYMQLRTQKGKKSLTNSKASLNDENFH